jgi:predicted bacteriocin transport accessory protein
MKLAKHRSAWILLLTLLMSCQTNSNLTTISSNPLLPLSNPAKKTMDDFTSRIDLDILTELSNENSPFLLYVGNPSCSSCLQFQPILLDWIETTKAMVYYFDTLQHLHQLSMFQQEFTTYFPEGFSTPTLYILTGNQRNHRITSNQAFFTISRFEALMNDYVLVSS